MHIYLVLHTYLCVIICRFFAHSTSPSKVPLFSSIAGQKELFEHWAWFWRWSDRGSAASQPQGKAVCQSQCGNGDAIRNPSLNPNKAADRELNLPFKIITPNKWPVSWSVPMSKELTGGARNERPNTTTTSSKKRPTLFLGHFPLFYTEGIVQISDPPLGPWNQRPRSVPAGHLFGVYIFQRWTERLHKVHPCSFEGKAFKVNAAHFLGRSLSS